VPQVNGVNGDRPRSNAPPARAGRTRAFVAAGAVALAVLAAVAFHRHRSASPPTPYNLLLISLDTVRQDVLGCYGHRPRHAPDRSPSPALDQLARDGVRMVDAYGSSSWTLPSHLSLMTGLTPLIHGVETEVGTLDPATPTMAEILQRHGYRTAGVYSAPYLEPHWGFGRGFDVYQAIYGKEVVAASQQASALRAEIERAAATADWAQYDELKRRQVSVEDDLNRSSERASTSDEVTDAARAQIERLSREGRPWFVFAHYFDPHCDYAPPPPYDSQFDPDYGGTMTGANCLREPSVAIPDPDRPGGLIRQASERDLEHIESLYEGEVAWVDAHIGALLQSLETLGLTRTTLVIVVADHGEEFFEHGNLGHRHTLYEESVRVPMLLRLPGVLPAGMAVRGPVSLADVLPTALDVLGLPSQSTPGATSFLPLVRGTVDATGRAVLGRLVMMFGGDVEVDTGEHVAMRQVMVQDTFRQGPIKITRTRAWPQFPTSATPELQAVFQREAAAQRQREQLSWIDVERFPDEPEAQQSTVFTDPGARAALDAFRAEYAALLPLRSHPHDATPLPENVRQALQNLGYVPPSGGPSFPEPDAVLPPPGNG
jgi:arylsulfatase A-like enzyme